MWLLAIISSSVCHAVERRNLWHTSSSQGAWELLLLQGVGSLWNSGLDSPPLCIIENRREITIWFSGEFLLLDQSSGETKQFNCQFLASLVIKEYSVLQISDFLFLLSCFLFFFVHVGASKLRGKCPITWSLLLSLFSIQIPKGVQPGQLLVLRGRGISAEEFTFRDMLKRTTDMFYHVSSV